MANTLTAVVDKLLAQGLLALRENAIMPLMVNRSYEVEAAQLGSSIDVPIPSAITTQNVAPGATPPATADVAPTSVSIPLDQWKEAPFYLTDKERLEVMNGTIPMQASEAIKSLANTVDSYILGLYTGVFGYHGVAGDTPFANGTTDANQARKVLHNQLAPVDDRRFVMDADAEANASDLRAFQDISFSGSSQTILDGTIGRKLGFNWFMDQNIPTHTAGTATGMLVNDGGDRAVGDTDAIVDGGSGTLVVGDVITFAGHSQTYTITAAVGDVSAATIAFSPGLKAIVLDDEAITRVDDHVVNLAFHRDAFAFATRPLESSAEGLGNAIQSAVDEVSGLTLRLEVSREHKRTRWSFDILYGGALVRPELATRVAG